MVRATDVANVGSSDDDDETPDVQGAGRRCRRGSGHRRGDEAREVDLVQKIACRGVLRRHERKRRQSVRPSPDRGGADHGDPEGHREVELARVQNRGRGVGRDAPGRLDARTPGASAGLQAVRQRDGGVRRHVGVPACPR